ncbi:HD-GYP domain-containing protein [Undibacterium sp. SXout7W]|uniref:HD-GYP domain-containing protein n=1 Tax=Undibacterium sp. SXout7W TaxID=3413049 RepID=UPI003BF06B7B
MNDATELISIEDVRVGMFIKLDLNWFEHSFSMNSFKIVSQDEIVKLRELKLEKVRVVPSKSESISSDQSEVATPEPAPIQDLTPAVTVYASLNEAKQARFEKLKKQKEEMARVEDKFVNAAATVKSIDKLIFSRPQETLQQAGKLVDSIADVFKDENYNFMYLIQQAGVKEEMYFHSLNVSILAMTLAHELKCSPGQIRELGMAGLFHDVGKVNIPEKILNKKDALNKAEQNFFELHPHYGVEVGKQAGMSKIMLDVIAKHHEYLDGSGYPKKLKSDSILMPVRIVTIANVYDNLCNHIDPQKSLTPHEALSSMYIQRRSQFDTSIMATMVKSLGIYPPGTLVRLSNGAIGLVVNVSIGEPMRPQILVYDESVPKDDAIVLDLSAESKKIYIEASLRPGMLPSNVFDYLNLRKRINYYVDTKKTSNNVVH